MLMQMGWMSLELRNNFIYSAIMAFAALLDVSGTALTKILAKMEDPHTMNKVCCNKMPKTSSSSGRWVCLKDNMFDFLGNLVKITFDPSHLIDRLKVQYILDWSCV
jgi:hypothetical protein